MINLTTVLSPTTKSHESVFVKIDGKHYQFMVTIGSGFNGVTSRALEDNNLPPKLRLDMISSYEWTEIVPGQKVDIAGTAYQVNSLGDMAIDSYMIERVSTSYTGFTVAINSREGMLENFREWGHSVPGGVRFDVYQGEHGDWYDDVYFYGCDEAKGIVHFRSETDSRYEIELDRITQLIVKFS